MSDTSSLLEDAAKGAAAGLPFGGPIGAAIGGLGGVLAHYAPSLLSDIIGQPADKAVAAAQAAVAVVQAVTGTDDPAQALAAGADPAVETQLRLQLAQISANLRQAELAAQGQAQAAALASLQATLADTADARTTMSRLSLGGSKLAWAPAFITMIVLAGFFAIAALVLLKQMDANTLLVGGMLTMASNVVNYWTGSTSSATANRSQLVDMAGKAADSIPQGFAKQLLPLAAAAAPLEAAAVPFLRGIVR